MKPIKTADEPKPDELSVYDKGPYYFDKPDCEGIIRKSKSGIGSIEPKTIIDIFKTTVKAKGKYDALAYEKNIPKWNIGDSNPPPDALPLNKWTTWTYQEYYDESMAGAAAMMDLGLEQHDTVTIYGFNSPFWFMSEISAVFAGGKAAGIYPSDNNEQVSFKVLHSNSSIACMENRKNLSTFEKICDEVPYLKACIVWDLEGDDNLISEIKRKDGTSIKVLSWDNFIKLGKDTDSDNKKVEERISKIKPEHPCAIIYTSGTTGHPKAVMISHDNLVFESQSVFSCISHIGNDNQERLLSYLPLSHVAGMLLDIMSAIVISSSSKGYLTVYFARNYDLKVGTLGARLKSVHPTIFLGVPRVWEKVAEKIKAIGKKSKGIKKKISAWARNKGTIYQENMQIGENGKKPSMYGIANKLVFQKIKKAIGLDCLKFAFSGAAPMTLDTLKFWGSLGININEVYGMSECTGATTWSIDTAHLWGSVGYALPSTEVKIFKVDENDHSKKEEVPRCKDMYKATEEEQGEICFRGRHIMLGYLANPKLGDDHVNEIKKKNESAIDSEGWLHSGDKGCMTETGMVKITGRYKELIIGAGGENIAPVPIEDNIKVLCPMVSNIVMIGNKRKFNTCLITLKCEGASGEVPGTDKVEDVVKAVDPDVNTVSDCEKSELVIKAIEQAIKDTNSNGEVCPSNASKIQKFTILPLDLSVETNDLTATLKLKRSVVENKYSKTIDAMMESKDVFVKFVQ